MQMTRFSSLQDPGYKAVSSQLWIWVDELESEQDQVPVEGTKPRSRYLIQSGGGPVMTGTMSAGRDICFNNNIGN